MLKDVLHTLSTRVVMIPVGIVTGVLTARLLTPSDRGLLTLLLILPLTVNALSHLGLDSASIYFHRKLRTPLHSLIGNCVLFAFTLGPVCIVGLWIFRFRVLGSVFEHADSWTYLAAIVAVPFVTLFQYLGGLTRATGDFRMSNARMVAEKGLFLLALILVLGIFRGGVRAAMLARLFVLVGISVTMLWKVVARQPMFPAPDLSVLSKMLRFGVKTSAQAIGTHLHARADLYLVAYFLSNADVAFYAIAAGLAERALLLPDSVGTVLYTSLTSRSDAEAAALTARVCRHTVAISVTQVVVVALAASPLVSLLYGPAYLPAILPMYVLMFGVISIGVTRVLMRYLTSVNQHGYNGVLVGTAMVINVGLNLYLIPRFGIVGAAFSSLFTYSLQGILVLVLFRRLTGLRWRSALLLNAADVRGLMSLLARRLGRSNVERVHG